MHAEHENEYSPGLRGLIAASYEGRPLEPCVRRREQMVHGADWRRSVFFNEYLRPSGLDDCLYGAVRTGPGSADGAKLMRTRTERPFDDEDCALLELSFGAFSRLWRARAPSPAQGDRGDATAVPGWVRELPPRLSRVLDLLATGLSEKEIADRAGLTYASTHQYVVELYRRGGVSSRAQLMARVLAAAEEGGAPSTVP
jgi:DNA-binding CsgD family transcriptional regulator